ncbi:winged helix-turn-helix domain-containing protein [Aureibacillus halotolerans]|uniref:Uncharacterized protein n=1 Tax=Aureibacillus halotolerans TaxID=1508390 RepID=A0A4R6TRD5_9BACI|nr:helix-turn-helix domain-containing protein [Aureibacillus halotolerans]TDQ34585.1 hypothetical protein EV213_1243 [Aureibacillus halotolerans]
MSDLNQLTKLLFDETGHKILTATSKESKTTKEIAKAIGVPASNLYYKINKLVGADALRLTEQTQQGNLIENYYSSGHLFEGDGVLIQGENLKKNMNLFTQHYLLKQKQMLKLLEKSIDEDANAKEDRVKFLLTSVSLSSTDWDELNELISDFLESKHMEEPTGNEIEVVVASAQKKFL